MAIDEENIEIIEEFVAESGDNISEVEAILIEMESGSCEADDDTLNLIFRAFHSVKGTAGFLELENIVKVTHLAESLLDLLRRGEMVLEPSHVSAFLKALDCVNRALVEVGQEGTDSCIADLAVGICDQLQLAMNGGTDRETAPEVASPIATPKVDSTAAVSIPAAVANPTQQEVAAFADYGEDTELLGEFIADSLELLDSVDASLAAAKDGIIGAEVAAEGLRGLHTIKGNCGFLGFFDLGELCHVMETAIGALVDGERHNIEPMFAAVDALRVGLSGVLGDGGGQVADLKTLVNALQTESTSQQCIAQDAQRPVASPHPELFVTPADICLEGPIQVEPPPETSVENLPKDPAPAPQVSEAKLAKAKQSPKSSIRVDTDKLDELMNLVGELIIAENMVTQNEDLEGKDFESFNKAALHLNRITRSLQDLTMSVRMVPIRPTFRKMLRVARDVAQKQGKDVELVLVGEDTEVDRSVAEAIGDPLVHLLRNAVDHGVEDGAERISSGKPERGQLRLSAHHEAGEVWVVLSDDGKGLNRDVIVQKAMEKGVITSADGLSDHEVYQLICEPGFSTASALSDISGRGVGMDVVKRNIEKLRGRLEISSALGKGTTFTLRIPLTLAIVEGMQVMVGEHSYTIPLFAIRESVAVEVPAITSLTSGDEVLELRGEFIPVMRLANLHNLQSDAMTWEDGVLVIVADGGMTMAVFVDQVIGQRQTVVKPLPGYLGSMQGLAGCSILSTGKISLVVDVQTLTERARAM